MSINNRNIKLFFLYKFTAQKAQISNITYHLIYLMNIRCEQVRIQVLLCEYYSPIKAISMQEQREYILANFQQYRTIQPTVIFLHGLPSALSMPNIVEQQLSRIGNLNRISIQPAGKDFYTAFAEFTEQISAAAAILTLDGNRLMNRQLRVFYGSTKFCPHFLRNRACTHPSCNYAHYLHLPLVHLKQQAKDIDHVTLAHTFVQLNYPQIERVIKLIESSRGRFLLPISVQRLKVQSQKEEGGGKIEEWSTLSKGIEQEVQVEEATQQKGRSRVQEFLDEAERFLTRLIFKSSEFVY